MQIPYLETISIVLSHIYIYLVVQLIVRQVIRISFPGSPVNKQKLANQILRGKEMGVAETSLTRVRDASGHPYVYVHSSLQVPRV